MTEQEALIILNAVPEIGSIRLKRLKDSFGSARKILSSSVDSLRKVSGISARIANNIKKHSDFIDLRKEFSLIKKQAIRILTISDKEYPDNLKNIFDPPLLLYVKGEIKKEDNAAVAIVGSRRSSIYGLSMAHKLSQQLADIGVTVVSGMARGIDSSVHRGCLKSRGRTIAVLGSGLGCIYPPENKDLFNQITESGAVVSEFSFATKPYSYNFPRRNRIISGLSLGVLVVEAARNSGALITADFALEQGREVFALPGKADSATSYGTNRLIKQGAKLVCSIEDILEEISQQIQHNLKKQETTFPESAFDNKMYDKDLKEEQRKLYNILSENPKHIDTIASEANVNIGAAASILMQLELKHLIKQIPGKLFIKKNV